jgi:hypothetical protein
VSTNPAGEIQATPLGQHAEAVAHGTFREPVGKRSPILGYNHNVRYRGLVFHVQTEDSGVASPHLFTHLFHHGVIVSTRKLEYDPGSAEESIKSLMQAQHKAVLKDLRRGSFDDKIDSYLGGTPGLLPRGVDEPAERASEIELAPSPDTVEEVAAGAPTEQVLPMLLDELSAPAVEKPAPPAPPPPPAPPRITKTVIPPVPPRTTDRMTVPNVPAIPTPSSGPPGAPSLTSLASAAAGVGSTTLARGNPGATDTTLKTPIPAFDVPEPDLSPEIEIQLVDDDEPEQPRRTTRDADMQVPLDQTRPTISMEHDDARVEASQRAATISDGIPGPIRPSSPAIPPPPPSDSRRLAATLLPARPLSRPSVRSAVTPPQVVSRPLPNDDRSHRESGAVEVYSPPPGSAELPPGERPGQYAQHKKQSGRIPIEGLKDVKPAERAPVPIPAGLGRPQRVPSPGTIRATPVPTPVREGRGGSHTEPLRTRAPTPARLPVTNRAGTGSGVVMTRPAVIVGAPQKSTGTVPRIRKAREDEGRGFGQGLISEKSLDEVILAYLSEDADEK